MTKSRKKILLSSIAMLLVALVALGSATFAWFTMNKTVTASGMNVTAATAKGLQLTGDNGTNWKRDWVFKSFKENGSDIDTVLSPVSLAYSETGLGENAYYPADVKRAGAYEAVSGDTPASATGWTTATIPDKGISTLNDNEAKVKNGYFVAYRVGIKSTDAAIGNVTMTLNYTSTATTVNSKSVDSKEFIRVVVVDSTGAVVANYGDAGNTTINNTAAVTGVSSADVPTTTGTQLACDLTETGITAPASTATPAYYTIYAWFEGQDSDCDDDHQALNGAIDITFGFTS